MNINYIYKDTLFKIVFGDHKENALALYNAVNGTAYTDANELTVNTLSDAVYISMKNDVSFIFDNKINLYEHQSTFNPNMPLRGLEYFSAMYNDYLDSLDGGRRRLYRSKLIEIPTPRFYVFYNGLAEQPEYQELRLSDAYPEQGDVEVVAHMININKGMNKEIVDVCKPLREYVELTERIRENQRSGIPGDEAIIKAVDSCIEDGIMGEILMSDRNRIISSLLTELSAQEIEELYREEGYDKGLEEGRAEGRKEGLEEGRKEGLEEGREQIVIEMVKSGTITAAAGAEALGKTEKEMKEIIEQSKAE